MRTAGTITPRPHSVLSAFVRKHSGQNPLRCYQCGKCTAGCPVAEDMDLGPRQVMRAVQLGLRDEILSCNSIWVCLQCQMCSARCPMDIDIARVMEALRLLAILEGHPAAEKDVELFNRIFLEVVKRHGRLHELELGAMYNLRSGNLTANAGVLPQMLSRGRLSILPTTIKDVGEIRQLFARAGLAWKRAGAGENK
ncbi:MAG TPA: 4Fe-4S dicluster domain-containing protein [Dehalococcoidia bacterium]|nr:4Fe-4S dicluster domain-containing protein [Dehalococcoidia bacterium]